MDTVKLNTDGKVILKDSKVSCSCCGGGCDIAWDISYFYGTISAANPWVVSNGGSKIRFNIENDFNCAEYNTNVQGGYAIGTITPTNGNISMDFFFDGIAELQDSGFENIEFFLSDGVVETSIATATSAGGGLGCAMGPIIQNISVPPPYLLLNGTTYTFRIVFDTADSLFHVDAFYEANFICTSAP